MHLSKSPCRSESTHTTDKIVSAHGGEPEGCGRGQRTTPSRPAPTWTRIRVVPARRRGRREDGYDRREAAAVLGRRIHALRIASGLSQSQLGAPSYTRAHISAIELGKLLPAVTTLVHLARRLKLPVRELIPPDL